MPQSTWTKVGLCLTFAATLAGCAAKVASPAAKEVDSGTDARQIVRTMASTLAAAPGFQVTIHSDYDAVQPDGQQIAFADRRNIHLQRPDRLRVDTTRSDGRTTMLLFDGERVTAFHPEDRAYVQIAQSGSVDDAVVFLVRDMQLTLPLARLLLTRLPEELDRLVTDAEYVERNVLLGEPTDHVALRSADVDLQLWITRTAERLPRRIVITYKNAPGQPAFRADLTGWDLTPSFSPDLFQWAPPAGTERLPVLKAPFSPSANLGQGGKP